MVKGKHIAVGGGGYCLMMLLVLGKDALIAILLLPVLFIFLIATGRLARWITHGNKGYYTTRRKK